MAKKKNFDNIVDESFNEGYQSEPDNSAVSPKADEKEPVTPMERKPAPPAPKEMTEKEQLLSNILSGDAETLQSIWGREDRSTYYLTDLHRACIDIMAHEEGVTKNKIVVDALESFFAEKANIPAAKERVLTLAVKKLQREIEDENNN